MPRYAELLSHALHDIRSWVIHSLALSTIYETLSGRIPFYQYLIRAVKDRGELPPKEPESPPSGLSYAQLCSTDERCWMRDPNERPSLPALFKDKPVPLIMGETPSGEPLPSDEWPGLGNPLSIPTTSLVQDALVLQSPTSPAETSGGVSSSRVRSASDPLHYSGRVRRAAAGSSFATTIFSGLHNREISSAEDQPVTPAIPQSLERAIPEVREPKAEIRKRVSKQSLSNAHTPPRWLQQPRPPMTCVSEPGLPGEGDHIGHFPSSIPRTRPRDNSNGSENSASADVYTARNGALNPTTFQPPVPASMSHVSAESDNTAPTPPSANRPQPSSTDIAPVVLEPTITSLPDIADLSKDIHLDQHTLAPHPSGAFGDVYRTTLISSGRPVAVKVLRMTHLGRTYGSDSEGIQERMQKRMLREMRLWSRLQHKRVTPLLGFVISGMGPGLISPWCAQGNVREYLRRNPSVNRHPLVVQVAEGLVYLYTREPPIIHSDLKACNVLINDDGEAMLCDFGASKLLEDVPSGLTTSNVVTGTLRWKAPELAYENPVTIKYTTDAAVLLAQIKGEVPTPVDYPELPAEDPLWPILQKCWSYDPESRPVMNEVYSE
ncbi:hypothetical protein FRB99_007772, partial [Tulasnella sp. 403]